MVTKIQVNIGSGNGLLPDGTKPLPEPMLTNHQGSHQRAIWPNLIGNAEDVYPWKEFKYHYHKTSNLRRTLVHVGNKIV